MHGLGPHNITVGGRQTTVRQELKETYSAIEEAKADISGLFAIQYLIDKGVLPKSLEQPLYTTFLASAFRSIRFGINEAHGRGIAIQLNYLLDQGGVRVRPDGTFAVDPAKVKDGVSRADARHHDDPGGGQLRGGEGARRPDGRRASAGAEGARQADGRADRHRAAFHDGGHVARTGFPGFSRFAGFPRFARFPRCPGFARFARPIVALF